MVETLQSERTLLKAVDSYYQERRSKMEDIRRVYDQWEVLHYRTQRSLWKNTSAPAAKFQLVRRITQLWASFKLYFLENTVERKDLADAYNATLTPDDRDLRGFTKLLLMNAETYNKSYAELLKPRSPYVTVDEILALSFHIKQNKLGQSVQDNLMKAGRVALYGLTEFGTTENPKKWRLPRGRFEYLSTLTDELYESGLWTLGFDLCQAMGRLFPQDDEFQFKVGMFSARLERANSRDRILSSGNDVFSNPDRDAYERGCRQQELVLPTDPDLTCFYFHKNPRLRHLAGYKVEEVSKSPLIRIYHDVLHEKEILLMQTNGFPLLKAALVFNAERRESEISDYRISNNGWFFDPDSREPGQPGSQPAEVDALYRRLNQRLEDCTGLNKRGTESIQMNNYGVGGHYAWHYDSLYYNAVDLDYYPDDRIATWMFYLNDVKEGGNTVFPRLNISLPPRKGAAVFWYNLHPSGVLDYRTLHGGCPILQGTKWVANMWVHEFDQIFVRPCPLDKEEVIHSFDETWA